jgi:hypothetical protein
VNSQKTSTSTTDMQWKPRQVALTATIGGVALSAHVLLHVSPVLSAVVAVAIVRPQALLGLLYGALIALFGVVYIPVKALDPSDFFTRALANVMNGLSGRDLIPAGVLAKGDSLSPLPYAASTEQREAVYEQLLKEWPGTRTVRAEGEALPEDEGDLPWDDQQAA